MSNARKSRTKADAAQPKDLGALMGPQAAHFLRAQSEIASEIEKFTSRWIERRTEVLQTALKTTGQMRQPEAGLTMAPAIMQDFYQSSVQCLAEDAGDWIALCGTCAGIVTAGEIEAGGELAKTAGLTNKPGKLPTRIPV
ncbi:MAG: hypothetical protein HKN18_02860 [Silicimonas sp.]|nr:hypothetical protein [Silicimonas sp.]